MEAKKEDRAEHVVFNFKGKTCVLECLHCGRKQEPLQNVEIDRFLNDSYFFADKHKDCKKESEHE